MAVRAGSSVSGAATVRHPFLFASVWSLWQVSRGTSSTQAALAHPPPTLTTRTHGRRRAWKPSATLRPPSTHARLSSAAQSRRTQPCQRRTSLKCALLECVEGGVLVQGGRCVCACISSVYVPLSLVRTRTPARLRAYTGVASTSSVHARHAHVHNARLAACPVYLLRAVNRRGPTYQHPF